MAAKKREPRTHVQRGPLTEEDVRQAWETCSSTWQSKRKIALWIEQKGHCFWCNVFCLLPFHLGYWRGKPGALSGNAATLDHLYSKLSPLRYKANVGPRYVMACNTCNGRRSQVECIRASNSLKLGKLVRPPKRAR